MNRFSFTEESEGVDTGLESIVLGSDSKSEQYFLWHNEIPCFE